MPKDAAYYELLVKSRRVRRDTILLIILITPVKIKSEMPQNGSGKICREKQREIRRK
jgi:hypothetical protein